VYDDLTVWEEALPAVYFAQCGVDGPIKIGWTAGPVESRLRQLQVGSPEELRLLGILHTEEAAELERELHERFATYRVRGEWYRPEGELEAFLQTYLRS
jgi:hypothetical protein